MVGREATFMSTFTELGELGRHHLETGERVLDFPCDLASGEWYVLHTKSRQEKALCEKLHVRGIYHYLPLVEQVHFCGRRKTVAQLPLFPGYVFLKGVLDQAYEADRTEHVAQIISVNNQEQLAWELSNIWLALSRHGRLDPYPHIVEGVKVEVRAGPFRGLQGIIESRKGASQRFVLQIKMLGRAVSLEIDAGILDRV
jgi:transcription antitermination factor NusG